MIEHGPTIGEYRGRTIPAYIVENGVRSDYVGVAKEDPDGLVPLAQLAKDECVIAPGLIYRRIALF